MAENRRVAGFRRELATGKSTGENFIGVANAVKALVSKNDVIACLNIWCDMYKPGEWPPALQSKQRAQFEQLRSAGEILFLKAVALATPENSLAIMVQQMAIFEAMQMEKGDEAKPLRRYANRYATFNATAKNKITLEIQYYFEQLRKGVKSKKLLIATLQQHYFDKNGIASKSLDDLMDIKFDEPAKRRRFEQLAAQCQQSWAFERRPPKTVTASQMVTAAAKGDVVPVSDGVTLAGKIQNVKAAFAEFSKWVAADMKSPVDFFRLASWVREPSNEIYAKAAKRRGKYEKQQPSAWSSVWDELYMEVVARAQSNSLSKWQIESMYQSRGFVGEDRSFIAFALNERSNELLWNRLKFAEQDKALFDKATFGRRRAHTVAQSYGLNLLDEITTVARLKHIETEWQKDPVKIAGRSVAGTVNRQPQKWWINQTIKDAFTVLWIEPGIYVGKSAGYALIEIKIAEGFVFEAPPPFSGLSNIHQEAFYRELAEIARIMTEGALALLKALGYAFDLATAIAGGGGIRMIVFRFVGEILADEAVELALDAADIQNPWLRAGIQLGVNFVPKPKLGLDVPKPLDVEYDTLMKSRAIDAAAAKTVKLDGADRAIAKTEIPNGKATAALNGKTLKFGDGPPIIVSNVKNTVADQDIVKRLYRKPEAGDSLVDDIVENVVERADDWAARAIERLGIAVREPVAEGAGGVQAMMLTGGSGRTATNAAKKGTGSAASAPPAPNPKYADKLRKSELVATLRRYDKYLDGAKKAALMKKRNDIIKGVSGAKSQKEAISKLTGLLNKTREETGEYVAMGFVMSNLENLGVKITDIMTIPVRRNDVPMLDVVFTAKGPPKNFLFMEVKGGESTGLGFVTPKNYSYKNGVLNAVPTTGDDVRQATGEWYYQRMVEIYNLGDTANKKLAMQMFDAAQKQNVSFLVVKSGYKMDVKFDLDTRPADWFLKQKWITNGNELPIPALDYAKRPKDIPRR